MKNISPSISNFLPNVEITPIEFYYDTKVLLKIGYLLEIGSYEL